MIKLKIRVLFNFFYRIRESLKYRKVQLPFKEYLRLRSSKVINESILYGITIKIADSFWYLFGLNEIFLEEVYKFGTKNKNPIIIDCGANIGLSIIYFKKLYPHALIIGFEPDNDIFQILKYNVDQFKLQDVILYQKAIWISEQPLIFKKNGSVGGHLTNNNGGNSINIESVRLKNFLNRKIDFLKIDIEGAEFEIVKDCNKSLKNVENIFIEYHSFHENDQMIGELLLILKKAGFKIYIKEALENMKHPYIEKKGPYFDLQLNIFGYRR